MEGDSIGSWVKTLLSDAFYWTDNDLVVQTRSMYGGAPREAGAAGPGASFLLDRGAKVSHFNYFSNDRTVSAIASALMDAAPADFARHRPAVMGRRGCERHACGAGGRAIARWARRQRGGSPGGVRAARHPRLRT